MEKMESSIEIAPKGSFFEVDSEGYLINPASLEKIQEKWKPLIKDIVELYKNRFSDQLRNVYIRGSVAKGEAVEGISDIDTYAYVTLNDGQIEQLSTGNPEKELISKYPFVESIELHAMPIETAQERDEIIFLNQSVCVYGTPIEVTKIKPGKDTIIHIPNIHKRIDWLKDFLSKEQSDKEIKSGCVWIMKGLLRSGCELVMERSKKYTRDLYPCYQIFSEYYPEKEPEMKEVLYLALNPTGDKAKIEEVMDSLGIWLQEQYKKAYE